MRSEVPANAASTGRPANHCRSQTTASMQRSWRVSRQRPWSNPSRILVAPAADPARSDDATEYTELRVGSCSLHGQHLVALHDRPVRQRIL